MKVLHVIEALDYQAVETWLLRMLRHARNRGVEADWSFYSTLARPGAMDGVARSLGAEVWHSPVPIHRKFRFTRALRAALLRGEYDVLHCHHDIISAVYLVAAIGLPIRRRVVHVHNADESLPTGSVLKQRLFRPSLRKLCLSSADRIVGISNHTLDSFLAGRPRVPGRDLVHYYGVESTRFEGAIPDRTKFRDECGLPETALVLLFAGRLVPEKNPLFVVEVVAELVALEPRAVAVFAGAGSLEAEIKARARELGVAESVRTLGWRRDIARVMCCSDWFILPHPHEPMEGFGLAVVEAQLAGLRMLLSPGIPDDPLLPSAHFRRIALSAPSRDWANAAMDMLSAPPPSRADSINELHRSPMDMGKALSAMIELYQ